LTTTTTPGRIAAWNSQSRNRTRLLTIFLRPELSSDGTGLAV